MAARDVAVVLVARADQEQASLRVEEECPGCGAAIYKEGNRWRGAISLGYGPDGKRIRKKVSGKTQAEVAEKIREKYKPNSVRNMRAVLRKALGQAEREGLVGRNVAALSMPPRIDADEGRTLTLDQVDGHRMGTLVLLALVFGLRRG
ncbi:hypothetical protein ACWDTT_37215 [Streptosporangium sandarakinum]|uniref:hypothetical protein n=1 Tax=Streptosporangium sandarakinum TaxID=1260955 RepID=UPI003D902CEF